MNIAQTFLTGAFKVFRFLVDAFETAGKNRRLNFGLLVLLLFVILFNLPFLTVHIYPQAETKPQFWLFLITYNQMFFHVQIPIWFPHSVMGMPGAFDMITHLSPANYLGMVLGLMFRITDALVLYNVSMVLEQILFLFGFYKLSMLLFRDKKIAFLLGFVAIGSLIWNYSLWWNFRIYYLVPLIFYSLIYSFQEKKSVFFWLAGIMTVLSMVGNLQYYVPIYLLVFTVLGAGFLVYEWKYLATIFRLERKNLAVMTAFLLIAGLYVVFLLQVNNGMSITVGNRNADTGQISLNDFLTMDMKSLLLNFNIFELLTGINGDRHNTYFIGLIPLFFFFYSLFIRKKDKFHKIFLVIVLVLVWMTISGKFSTLLYYFPMMSMFRNKNMLFSFIKIFVILCSGYGIVSFLDKIGTYYKSARDSKIWSFNLVLFLTILVMFWDSILVYYKYFAPLFYYKSNIVIVIVSMSVQVSLFLMMIAIIKRNLIRVEDVRKYFIYALFACAIFSLTSFQVRYSLRYLFRQQYPSVSVRDVSYQPVRVDIAAHRGHPDNKPEELMSFDKIYWLVDNAKSLDTYKSDALTAFTPDKILKIIQLFGKNGIGNLGIESVEKEINGISLENKIIAHSIARELPKIRIGKNILFARDEKTVGEIMIRHRNEDKVVVIDGYKAGLQGDLRYVPDFTDKDQKKFGLKVRKFTLNSIDMELNVPAGGQYYLYYSDGYHPGWHAQINGKPVKVYQANLAFKAVELKPGQNKVSFRYFYGLQSGILIGLVVVSMLFALTISFLFVKEILTGYRSERTSAKRLSLRPGK